MILFAILVFHFFNFKFYFSFFFFFSNKKIVESFAKKVCTYVASAKHATGKLPPKKKSEISFVSPSDTHKQDLFTYHFIIGYNSLDSFLVARWQAIRSTHVSAFISCVIISITGSSGST